MEDFTADRDSDLFNPSAVSDSDIIRLKGSHKGCPEGVMRDASSQRTQDLVGEI